MLLDSSIYFIIYMYICIHIYIHTWITEGFPNDSVVKNPSANAGDAGLISGSKRSPGGGNGNPLQCSCLGNPHGQRSMAASSPWCHELDRTERLNTALPPPPDHAHTLIYSEIDFTIYCFFFLILRRQTVNTSVSNASGVHPTSLEPRTYSSPVTDWKGCPLVFLPCHRFFCLTNCSHLL